MPAPDWLRSTIVLFCALSAAARVSEPLAGGDGEMAICGGGRSGFSACYGHGTSQQYIEQFEQLTHPSPGPNAYNASNRWTQTATDGFVASNGMPITLTYSFPPDTNTGDPATSNVIHATLDAQFGARETWKALFADFFSDWSDTTGITFTEVNDDGGAWPDADGQLGSRGDVRIVSFAIDGLNNVLAYNYFPNGGDMALDSAENWADSASNFAFLRNVVTHEAGHGIGLGHTLPRDGTKLMEAFINLGFVGPQDDDIRGAGFFYGDTYEPNGSSGFAVDLGDVSATTVVAAAGLHNAADADWYSYTVIGQQTMAVIAAPIGAAYSVGPDPGGTSVIDTRAINPLTVEIYDSTGSTLLQSRTAVAGESATTSPITGVSSADEYLVRISTSGSAHDVQRYQLSVELGEDNMLNVQSTPIGGVLVNVTPPDASGDGNGTTGFSRNYATGASVQLSAASVSGFHVFERWVVGGVSQPVGQNVVNITMPAAGTTALAHYTDPSELTAYAGPDDEVVAGEATMLEGSSAGGDAPLFFSWSPAESLSSPASDQTLAEPSDTTTYTLTVTDIAGRSATDTVTLHVVEPLKVDVGAAQTVLANQTFVVSGVVTGGARPYSYEWSSSAALEPSTGESVFGKTSVSTSVTLSVTDAKGRTGSDTATVAVASLVSVDAGEDQIIEIGLGTTLSGSVSGGVPPYTFIWMPSGIPATVDQSVIRFEPSETTDYALAVTDDLGQRAVDTVRVVVVSPLTVSAGDAVEIELGDVVVLNGSAAGGTQPYRYRWSPAGGLSDAENKRPQVTPDQTTSYTLAVTDDEGQTAQTSVTITVVAPPPEEVSAPTVGPCGVGLLPVLAIVTASLLPMRRKRRSRW